MVTPVRSRKVRKILRLEARARRLLTRYERALDKATRAKGQAHALLDAANRFELTLTGTQLGELRRARSREHHNMGHYQKALADADELVSLRREEGFAARVGNGLMRQGAARVCLGQRGWARPICRMRRKYLNRCSGEVARSAGSTLVPTPGNVS